MKKVRVFTPNHYEDAVIDDVMECKQEDRVLTVTKSDGRVIFINLDKTMYVAVKEEK